uniref:Uncharacterized protein n=1 Tax=Arundo donax TaxID=35708 RepID=A0A0A9CD48_ARUDO
MICLHVKSNITSYFMVNQFVLTCFRFLLFLRTR